MKVQGCEGQCLFTGCVLFLCPSRLLASSHFGVMAESLTESEVGGRRSERPALLRAAELVVWDQGLLGLWLPDVTFVFNEIVKHQAECFGRCGTDQRKALICPQPFPLTSPISSACPLTSRLSGFYSKGLFIVFHD